MTPAIFPLVTGSAAATALLGTSPTRFYPCGEAPENVAKPYATWFVVSGVPENYLDCPPNIDSITVQVDVWADSQTDARDVFEALRKAFEGDAHIMGVGPEGREPDTRLYRHSMTVDFWQERT